MTAILLGWNPAFWNDWQPNYPSVRDELRRSGTVRERWSVGGLAWVEPGVDAWLVLQGEGARGLIGHGVGVSEIFEDADGSCWMDIEFDTLLEQGDHLQDAALSALVPGVAWAANFGPARSVTGADEAAIRNAWAAHRPLDDMDPSLPVPGAYPQSALSRVSMNRYERNVEARRICLAQHGFSCAVCRFDFEAVYGPVGRGFISVHHLVPASQLGPDYELDPVRDLLPLCPNCHSMVHRRIVPFTPAELRRMISGGGFIEGTVVSQVQLDSQADARKLLD